MKKWLVCAVTMLVVCCISCEKDPTNNCVETPSENINKLFAKEVVYDSLMPVDTTFSFFPIKFEVDRSFESGSWYLSQHTYPGTNLDQRAFDDTGHYNIQFTGVYRNPCTNVTDQKQLSKQIVIYDKQNAAKRKTSPFVGEYLGYTEGNPVDTFRIKIDFFNKEDYPSWSYWATHSQTPFYWISNFPKGFRNTTSDGLNYPELSSGYQPYMTYKNFCLTDGYIIAADNTAHNIKAYSSLTNRDSLVINYSILDTSLYNQTHQIKFIKKRFLGVRK